MGRSKTSRTEITAKLEAFDDLRRPLEPSEFVDLTDEERRIFDDLALSRHVSDWLPAEIVMLAQAAQLTAQVNELAIEVRLFGPTELSEATGRHVQTAASLALVSLDKSLMAKITKLKLGTATAPQTLQAGGRAVSNAKRLNDAIASDEDNALLASPLRPN